jgi:hypothetical protein
MVREADRVSMKGARVCDDLGIQDMLSELFGERGAASSRDCVAGWPV